MCSRNPQKKTPEDRSPGALADYTAAHTDLRLAGGARSLPTGRIAMCAALFHPPLSAHSAGSHPSLASARETLGAVRPPVRRGSLRAGLSLPGSALPCGSSLVGCLCPAARWHPGGRPNQVLLLGPTSSPCPSTLIRRFTEDLGPPISKAGRPEVLGHETHWVGAWIRTTDLQVMSLTSYQTAPPRHRRPPLHRKAPAPPREQRRVSLVEEGKALWPRPQRHVIAT